MTITKRSRVAAVILLALGASLAIASTPAAAATTLDVVGKSDLGGKGLNGDVATVGDTAVVGGGIPFTGGLISGLYSPVPCAPTSVKVVDLSRPSAPRPAAEIPVPKGAAAVAVDAVSVSNQSFQGDLAAVALARCAFEGNFVDRGVAYYDVTDPDAPRFLGRYMADDFLIREGDPPCDGSTPPRRCAQSEWSVSLAKRPDGKVLSFSTQPFSAPSGYPVGDVRIVDVTDPRAPDEVAGYPPTPEGWQANATTKTGPPYGPKYADNFPGFSHNGCRPFFGGRGHAGIEGGTDALVAYFDDGLTTLDLSNPAAPVKLGQFSYGDGRTVEGNAAHVASTTVGGRSLALLSDEDWVGPATSLRITDPNAPASLQGSTFACEAMFTLFDPDKDAQLYAKPGGELRQADGGTPDVVYVGRGCPAGGSVGTTKDPYLVDEEVDVEGKIVLRDRGTVSSRQSGLKGICSFASAVKRAQDAGALGVVVINTSTSAPEAFSADGVPDGLEIPMAMIDKADGDALRDALCPDTGTLGGGCETDDGKSGALEGILADGQGSWGGLRVVDVTDRKSPTQVAEYHTAESSKFPPPDHLGVYSVHHAIAKDGLAYAAWNSAGLRVLDLTGATPKEIASFVPPDTEDPSGTDTIPDSLPAKAYVTGVDLTKDGQVVITDRNSGLYVLSAPPRPQTGPPPASGGSGGGAPAAEAAPTEGPKVGVSRRTRTSSSGGAVLVRLSCPADAGGGCKGTVTLETARRVRRASTAARKVRLGRARFSIPAGRKKTVKVKLSRRGRALLRGGRKVRAKVIVRARDGAGRTSTSTRTVTLKRKAGRRRR